MNQLVQATLQATCATMTCVKVDDMEALQELLRSAGYTIHIADLGEASDEVEMSSRIAACLTHGSAYIDLHKGINMPALGDLLTDGLVEQGKMALLVTQADSLVEQHINLVFNLFVTFALENQRLRDKGFQTLITTFLVGSGPNFAREVAEDTISKFAKEYPPKVRTQVEIERQRRERGAKLRGYEPGTTVSS